MPVTLSLLHKLDPRSRKMMAAVRRSGLFDPAWYLAQNPDVARSGQDPLEHFMRHGVWEGRDPNPLFNLRWYLKRNRDVAQSRLNPLLHYIQHGAREGRNPSPHFDSRWYLDQYPDVVRSGDNPLGHYLKHGAAEGRDPSPHFDTDWYAAHYPDVAASGLNPLAHYAQVGAADGRIACVFDWDPPADLPERIAAYRQRPPGQRKIAVVTVIMGEYDTLMVHDRPDPDVDYLCFTNRPLEGYGVWQLRRSPYYHPDPTRMARYVKMHLHELLPGYEVAVWVDANIVIRGEVMDYVRWLREQDVALGLLPHPNRECVYEEAEACKRLKKDDPDVIDRQMAHYQALGVPTGVAMYETNFWVARLDAPQVSDFFRRWWQELDQFSRRDQLGIHWALAQSRVSVGALLPKGTCVRNHPDFTIYRHEQTRRFTSPIGLRPLVEATRFTRVPRFAEVKETALAAQAGERTDVIVCVHNALEDVQRCLEAARDCWEPGQHLIIVNDRSDEETSAYLRAFALETPHVELLENAENLGYTGSANRGLAAATAPFRIMLNSDTIVSPQWVAKMRHVAFSSENIGIVGPLSNAASTQSIPNVKSTAGQTAINPMPPGMTPAQLDALCEQWSFAGLYPVVPLVHGFCFGIKQSVIDAIGLFDEVNFARFYGEENDYCFRARRAGFTLAVATPCFVYHRKSRSIQEEVRLMCMSQAGKRLRELYTEEAVATACKQMDQHPLLQRMRDLAQPLFALEPEPVFS